MALAESVPDSLDTCHHGSEKDFLLIRQRDHRGRGRALETAGGGKWRHLQGLPLKGKSSWPIPSPWNSGLPSDPNLASEPSSSELTASPEISPLALNHAQANWSTCRHRRVPRLKALQSVSGGRGLLCHFLAGVVKASAQPQPLLEQRVSSKTAGHSDFTPGSQP